MNTHALIDSFKKYSRFQRVEEPKKKAGGLSLVFSGAVFSLLGGSYLYKYAKSGFFSRTQYVPFAEAMRKLRMAEEGTEIPVLLSGKIARVHGDYPVSAETMAIYKRTTELHSHVFDEYTKSWRDRTDLCRFASTPIFIQLLLDMQRLDGDFILDYRTEGCSFDVITSNGSLVTVEVHPALFSHTIQLFSLYPVSDKEITGEEREMYIQSTDLIRFSDSNALDKTIRVKEEGVKVGQYVHIRGLLVKREEDHLIVRGGQGGKLTISSHPIEEESENQLTRGIGFFTLGMGLLLAAYYRLQ